MGLNKHPNMDDFIWKFSSIFGSGTGLIKKGQEKLLGEQPYCHDVK